MSEIIDKAVAILQQNPLPDDAEQQLAELEEKGDNIDKMQFQRLWEALFQLQEDFNQHETRV